MKRSFWLGFVSGTPFVEFVMDSYGGAWRAELFTSRAAARRRFHDVRRVVITEAQPYPKPKKKARRRP